jgi:tetratricopeptide (TPR) repeat protein
VELLGRKAALWEEEFKKIDQATECYEKILSIEQANQPAFRALERLYRQLSRWQDLLELYRNRIFAIQDNTEILENYLHIGTIWAERLGDDAQAIEAFTSMLDIDPDSVPALDWLSRLFEKASEDDKALEYMNRLVDLLDDPKQRVELYYRMGKIYEERLQDVDAAIGKYQFASDVDPSYLPVAKALVDIYKAREDWENAVLVLKSQEQHTADPEEKAHLLFEAGDIYRGKLYSEPQAQEYFEKAMQMNPQSTETAGPLSDIYFGREMWAQAEPLLDLLTTAARRQSGKAKEGADQLNTWHYRSALVSDKLGKYDKADEQYRFAYELNAQHLPTLVGLADLYYRTEQWDKSFKLFQTVLVHHRDAQSPEEIVEIFYKLGNIKLRLGEKRKALNMYEKALEVNPHHGGTLDAIVDLYEKANDWENVINYKRSKVEAATNEKERFNLLMEIGTLWHEKLKNVPKAIQSFQDALDQDPASRNALTQLMGLYTDSRQWKKSIEVMEKIAELEDDPKRRSKYWYAVATIYRDELKQPEESVEFFNKSLDDDADFLKAFEAIDTIFTGKKDWKNLERNYRKMIKRVPQENKDLQIMLWHGLGEIYRSRMGQPESAATAFEVASSLDPNNVVRHEILAELWSSDPEKWEKAVQRHHILIGINPNRVESFKALYQIYMNSQQYDKAFCVAGTLKFLRQAPPDAEGFYEQYKQKGLVRAKRRLDAELWRKGIVHKNENPFIGAVFGLIGPAVAGLYRKELKRYVKKKERVDLATSPLTFCRYFSYVAQTLGVTVPELYHKPGAMGLNFLNADVPVPVVVVGDDMLQGRTEKELVFLIAKHLTYMRPEYYLIRALEMQTLTLKAIFLATLKLIIPSANVPVGDAPAVQQVLPVIQKTVPPTVMGQVKKILEHFLQAQGGVDLSRWMEHAELTANRVGYILCGELEQSAHTIQTEATPLSSMTVKDKIQDLVQYSISEEYLKVRAALGMSITG